LPLLAAAEQVIVATVNATPGAGGHGEEPGADIALHLARHGLRVEVEQLVAPELDAGNALLSRAAERGCDLLVIGGYGHARLRELILGGVTRTVLQSMTVPVLMAH
jgi:nucleotide-binding universal stress UspA family protein